MISRLEMDRIWALALKHSAIQKKREFETLLQLLQQAPVGLMGARVGIEIGTRHGGTTSALCQITDVLVSVDIGDVSSRLTPKEDFEGCHFIHGHSQGEDTLERVEKIIPKGSADYVFLDGNHSYEDIKADYFAYRDFVEPGGFIIFHDICVTDYTDQIGIEVGKFWLELIVDEPHCLALVEPWQLYKRPPELEAIVPPHPAWGGIGCVLKT